MSRPSDESGGLHILVVQHSEQAPGGNFCRGLEKRSARLTVCKPLTGGQLPGRTDGFDGLVVLGGPQHAADDEVVPQFVPLMELMRQFDRERKPVAGICLGCQLLARAHGGKPWNLGVLEFGFIHHGLTDKGTQDPVLGGETLPALMAFHEDSFDLPEGAALLVEGSRCRNQCFKVGNASYGFQFHLEVDAVVVKTWLDLFRNGKMEHYNAYHRHLDTAYFEELSAKLSTCISESEKFCDRIAGRWLALAKGYDGTGSE